MRLAEELSKTEGTGMRIIEDLSKGEVHEIHWQDTRPSAKFSSTCVFSIKTGGVRDALLIKSFGKD